MRRKERFSAIRIALIVGVIGIVIIGVGVLSFFADQASRHAPFEIVPYPGAERWGERDASVASRSVFYRTTDAPESVAAYYQTRMNEHYGDESESCVRIPPEGNAPISDRPNSVPFQYTCMFDRSGFQASQYTQVFVYPGLPNPDPFYDAEGMTVIKYEQHWEP